MLRAGQFSSFSPTKSSGGQQQRVAIARTLMQEPKLILVDEPVASLDPQAGKDVMDLLWSIVREQKLTVICTLHQLELAQKYGDRIIGLKDGKIQLDSAVSNFNSEDLTSLYQSRTQSRFWLNSNYLVKSQIHPRSKISSFLLFKLALHSYDMI